MTCAGTRVLPRLRAVSRLDFHSDPGLPALWTPPPTAAASAFSWRHREDQLPEQGAQSRGTFCFQGSLGLVNCFGEAVALIPISHCQVNAALSQPPVQHGVTHQEGEVPGAETRPAHGRAGARPELVAGGPLLPQRLSEGRCFSVGLDFVLGRF